MEWWNVASGGGAEGGPETPKKRSWFGNKKTENDKTAAPAAAEGEGGEGEGEEKNTVEAPKKVSFVGKLFKKKQPADKEEGEVILTKPYLNSHLIILNATLSWPYSIRMMSQKQTTKRSLNPKKLVCLRNFLRKKPQPGMRQMRREKEKRAKMML